MDLKSKLIFMSSMCLLFAAYSYSDVRHDDETIVTTTSTATTHQNDKSGVGYGAEAVHSGILPVDPSLSQKRLSSASALDERLLNKIHHTNLMEIEMGRMAQSKGTTSLIRAYGDRLERDHRFADQKILILSQQMGVNPDASLPFLSEDEKAMKTQMNRMERLHEASGANFDAVFLEEMRKGHSESIEMLTNADQLLDSNREIKSTIRKLIPILKQHEAVANHLTLNLALQ